jgi:hypothetical protein
VHITTKSRRYSTTRTALRSARTRWVRHQQANQVLSSAVLTNATARKHDSPIQSETGVGDDSMVWEFDRTGHVSLGLPPRLHPPWSLRARGARGNT